MRQSSTTRVILASILLLLAAPVMATEGAKEGPAVGVVLEQGQWRFDISTLQPMATEPDLQSAELCADGSPIGPSTLMPWAEEQSCKLKNIKVEKNKLTWKISCKMEGEVYRGRGEFEAKEGEAKGKARIAFDVAGQRATLKMKWSGERLGPCVPEAGGAGQ
jgi:hypothetical protein